jgi:hypothetical protein
LNHVKALGIKFIVISIVLLSILGIFSGTATFGEIMIISFLVTGVSYILGDLFVLPKLGNVMATIGDFGLSFLSVWALSSIFLEPTFSILTASFFASIFITLSEAIIHPYIQSKVLMETDKTNQGYQSYNRKQELVPARVKYQTEFAEENEVNTFNKESKLKESPETKKNQG